MLIHLKAYRTLGGQLAQMHVEHYIIRGMNIKDDNLEKCAT